MIQTIDSNNDDNENDNNDFFSPHLKIQWPYNVKMKRNYTQTLKTDQKNDIMTYRHFPK